MNPREVPIEDAGLGYTLFRILGPAHESEVAR